MSKKSSTKETCLQDFSDLIKTILNSFWSLFARRMGEDNDNALRIQTENLSWPFPPSSTSNPLSSTSAQNPISNSLTNDSNYTSSPIITPSGTQLLIPHSALTPLPTPRISNSNFSLDGSPRKFGYGLGVGMSGERRNVSEFVPSPARESVERSVSTSNLSGIVEDGLRREFVSGTRPRQSSLDEELFVLWQLKYFLNGRSWSIGAMTPENGFPLQFNSRKFLHWEKEHSPKSFWRSPSHSTSLNN